MWHLSSFNPSEITDIAVEIEKNGEKLYQRLAERALDQDTKELLLYLADEEGKHQDRFKELGKALMSTNVHENYPGEYLDYVNSIVENHLFSDAMKLDSLIESSLTKLDIIKLALAFEKDTILFFSQFSNLVGKDKRAVIDDLIMEEQIHIVKLNRLKKEALRND